MANVTLSIEDEVLQKARIRAVREGTSVNELCRRYLREYASQDKRYRQAIDRILEMSAAYHGRLVGKRATREEMHERKPRRGR